MRRTRSSSASRSRQISASSRRLRLGCYRVTSYSSLGESMPQRTGIPTTRRSRVLVRRFKTKSCKHAMPDRRRSTHVLVPPRATHAARIHKSHFSLPSREHIKSGFILDFGGEGTVEMASAAESMPTELKTRQGRGCRVLSSSRGWRLTHLQLSSLTSLQAATLAYRLRLGCHCTHERLFAQIVRCCASTV
jgi:hypothetical protein